MSIYQKFFSQKISSLVQQLYLLNVQTHDNLQLQPLQLDQFPSISHDNLEFFNLFSNLDTQSIVQQLQVKNYHTFYNNYFLILLIIFSYQSQNIKDVLSSTHSNSSQQQNNLILQILRDFQASSEQQELRSFQKLTKSPVYQQILELIQNNNDIFTIISSNIKDIIKNQNVNNFIESSLNKYKNDPSFKKILNIFNDFQKQFISKDDNNKINIRTSNLKISNILRQLADVLDEESLLFSIQSDLQTQRFSIDDFTEIFQNVLQAIHQNIDSDTFQKSQQMFLQLYSYAQSGIDLFGSQISQYFPSVRRHHLQKILELLKIIKLGFESIDKQNFQRTALKTKIQELQKSRSKKTNQTQIRVKQ